MKLKRTLLLVLFLAVTLCTGNAVAEYDNNAALQGINRASVYFDVNVGEAPLLLKRMELLDRTVTQLDEDGLQPTVVVGFRGRAAYFVTEGDHYVLADELEHKRKIQDLLQGFMKRGMTIELCSIAAQMYEIDANDIIAGVQVVKNGYVSLVGYQLHGYAVVPMD